MRFFHLADLHLGKTLHGFSLIDQGDQPAWVEAFLRLCDEEKPDAVVIAGDVYDRSVPSRDAVDLLDHLLTQLASRSVPVLMIAGNHDSGPRLNFASALLGRQGVHIAGNISAEIRCVTLRDDFGPIHFWLMPYLFPAAVEEALGMGEMRTYDAAARALIERQQIDASARNVLVAHQLVLSDKKAPEAGGSETMVGGVGQIDCSAFDAFDYVALGHIHRPQTMGRSTVRYAGSPLCYHFSEIGWKKGPLMVEIGEKGGEIRTELFEIAPLHPLREVRGKLAEIVARESSAQAHEEHMQKWESSRRTKAENSAQVHEEYMKKWESSGRTKAESSAQVHEEYMKKWEPAGRTKTERGAQGEYIRAVLTDDQLPSGAVETLSALFRSKNSFLLDVAREPERLYASLDPESITARAEKDVAELFGEFYHRQTGGGYPDGAEEALIRFAAEQTGNMSDDITPDEAAALAQKLVDFALKQEDDA